MSKDVDSYSVVMKEFLKYDDRYGSDNDDDKLSDDNAVDTVRKVSDMKIATSKIIDTVSSVVESANSITASIGLKGGLSQDSKSPMPQASKSDMKKLYQEFTEKLEAYRSDKIYMYLKGKYYGTPKYRGTGINKNMDSMLAGWCHFNENFRQESLIIEVMTRLEDMGVAL